MIRSLNSDIMIDIESTLGKPLKVGMGLEYVKGQYIGSWCDGATIYIHPTNTNDRKDAERRLMDFVIEQLTHSLPVGRICWRDWVRMSDDEVHKLIEDANIELTKREVYAREEARFVL